MLKFILIWFLPFSLLNASLENLALEVKRDLELLNYPTLGWRTMDDQILDVAIIGGGMSGVAIGFGLNQLGVYNIRIFDQSKEGQEGQWVHTARMKVLRSGKNIPAPSLGILVPHLTFRAWYEAVFGDDSWDHLGSVPTTIWSDYLIWLRNTLNLPTQNGWSLQQIVPQSDGTLELIFDGGQSVLARKVILATGRAGLGGLEIPSFVKELPKNYWSHTGEMIDFTTLKNKSVVVVGAGASAFDAAGAALEHGAGEVKMLIRKAGFPKENPFAPSFTTGFNVGFYGLKDEEKLAFFQKAVDAGPVTTAHAFNRLKPFGSSFKMLFGTSIESVGLQDNQIHLETSKGPILSDFIILGTGYAVNVAAQKELFDFADQIDLWGDHFDHIGKMGSFPYLGPNFEFQEKNKGEAPFLRNIYCFNYGAFLSHGRISGDIDQLGIGVRRLTNGVAQALFKDSYGE